MGILLCLMSMTIIGTADSIYRANRRKENALARMRDLERMQNETTHRTNYRPYTPTRRVLHHESENTGLHHHRQGSHT